MSPQCPRVTADVPVLSPCSFQPPSPSGAALSARCLQKRSRSRCSSGSREYLSLQSGSGFIYLLQAASRCPAGSCFAVAICLNCFVFPHLCAAGSARVSSGAFLPLNIFRGKLLPPLTRSPCCLCARFPGDGFQPVNPPPGPRPLPYSRPRFAPPAPGRKASRGARDVQGAYGG